MKEEEQEDEWDSEDYPDEMAEKYRIV